MQKTVIKKAVKANLEWFRKSGVMLPSDGSWGVAERIVITPGNEALDKIYSHFPAWTPHDGWSVIEQRRADCNFEAALMFFLAYEAFQDRRDYETGGSLLDFLYFRSGLLNRNLEAYPAGSWRWSHARWTPTIWFDDNGWNAVIQLILGRRYPELNARYDMIGWGLKLADSLLEGFNRAFRSSLPGRPDQWADPTGAWTGRLQLPHWGSLVGLALTLAHQVSPKPGYAEAVERYHLYLAEKPGAFNASEQAYALIGASWAAKVFDHPLYHELTAVLGDALEARMDPETGNIPAEHFEAPVGPHLADTIYTVNWALLGFQNRAALTGRRADRSAFEKLLKLVTDIQDQTPEAHVKGCWRGMYDLKRKQWGGGDCFEGGANSLYSGWTNAPITWCLLMRWMDRSLLDG